MGLLRTWFDKSDKWVKGISFVWKLGVPKVLPSPDNISACCLLGAIEMLELRAGPIVKRIKAKFPERYCYGDHSLVIICFNEHRDTCFEDILAVIN